MSAIAHLIDASPYIFRSYFALPTSMVDPEGASVNAVYGFAAFLIKYVADERPTHMAVAFDQSLNTSFRNELYPEYKAQRELPPAELEAQQLACQEVARALGCATFVSERYEADDLLGTLCRRIVDEGHGAVIISSDKDLTQLVGPRVSWANPSNGTRMESADVVAKFGVRPDQIVDYLGLAGDSVDNIPGVAGIGPKTAAALLGEFADLDQLYAQLERVAELELRGARTLGKKLAAARELAFLSRQLATLDFDAPLQLRGPALESLTFRGAQRELIDALFARLGFGSLAERITSWQ